MLATNVCSLLCDFKGMCCCLNSTAHMSQPVALGSLGSAPHRHFPEKSSQLLRNQFSWHFTFKDVVLITSPYPWRAFDDLECASTDELTPTAPDAVLLLPPPAPPDHLSSEASWDALPPDASCSALGATSCCNLATQLLHRSKPREHLRLVNGYISGSDSRFKQMPGVRLKV